MCTGFWFGLEALCVVDGREKYPIKKARSDYLKAADQRLF